MITDGDTAVSCNCRSHNRQIGERPEALLDPPAWLVLNRMAQWPDDTHEEHHRPVSIDACIAPAVQALWDAGYVTRGSCCGHNQSELGGPSLVIDDVERDYAGIRHAIATVDDRPYRLMQWQLIEVPA